MTRSLQTILFVDDDVTQLRGWLLQLRRSGNRLLLQATSCAAALELARQHQIDLAIVDQCLNGEWGGDVIRELLNLDARILAVLTSATLDMNDTWEAGRLNALFSPKVRDWAPVIEAIENEQDLRHVTRPAEVSLSLPEVQTQHIARVMRGESNNITRSAAILDISRHGLKKKLAKMGYQAERNK